MTAWDHVMKKNDGLPYLKRTLVDSNGPVDLSGYTAAKFFMRPWGSDTLKINGVALTEVNAAAGEFEYRWVAGDTDTAGIFSGEFEITLAGGKKLTFPNGRRLRIHILSDLG